MGLIDVLFARFHEQLAQQGDVARAGQMIDAKCPGRVINAKKTPKAGQPEAWDEPGQQAKRRHKDTDARWTKKNDATFYGYKNHINADEKHKRIQRDSVTHAAVHDSQVFDERLAHRVDDNGNKRPAYGDNAYHSENQEQREANIDNQGSR